jgi:YggT family protein
MGLIVAAIRIYMFVMIARAVFSWLPPRARANEVYRFLYRITEPLLRPVRQVLPAMGGVDFSPLLVMILLAVLARALAGV